MVGRFRRTVIVAWAFVFASALAALAVAISVGHPAAVPRRMAGSELAWGALVLAALCLALSRVVPGHLRSAPGVPPEQGAYVRFVLSAGFCFGGSLWAAFAWALSGRAPAMAAWAISLAGLLLAFPSVRRWEARVRAEEETAAPAPADAPPPPARRTVLFHLAFVTVPAVVAVALLAVGMWSAGGHARPPAWIQRAISAALGVTMVAIAARRWFLWVPRSRRPRWDRAVAVLGAVIAAWLFVFAARGR